MARKYQTNSYVPKNMYMACQDIVLNFKTILLIVQLILSLFLLSTIMTADSVSGPCESLDGTNLNCGPELRIALVNPTFTSAAYNHTFYDFYKKHNSEIYHGVKVTEDLNLMTSKIPENLTVTPLNGFIHRFKLPEHIRQLLPNASISIITDSMVNDGKIFKKNGDNAYDVIMIFHEEYVTPLEYDNFRRFVSNGGTLMAMSGNAFYAEVDYDSPAQTVTLVKGHGFAFDGHSVKLSVAERWQNESQQWLGSNFYRFALPDYPIRFYNNPFNYTGTENNFVSNRNAQIILNYNSSDTRYPIATYQLGFGKGKVVATGIASENVMRNTEFMKLIDDLLVNHAIPTKFKESVGRDIPLYVSPVNNEKIIPPNDQSGLDFKPWGEDTNHLQIKTIYNGTSGMTIFRIHGNTSNGTAGFASQPLDYKGKDLYVTVGDVLKYGNFSNPSNEYQVSFKFDIKGLKDMYHLVLIHGPFYSEGWHNTTYYQKIASHSTRYFNLQNLLSTVNDTFSSVDRLIVAVARNTVVNPLEFEIRPRIGE